MKVAVVGAGISGLLAVKYCKTAGLDVTCYEQNSEPCGIWTYSEKVGETKYGLKVHSAIYKNLQTNVMNDLMGFQDFPFPNSKSSYTTNAGMHTFLKRYIEHFDLSNKIKLEHHVSSVTPISAENNRWRLRIKNLPLDAEFDEEFDSIFICNGHYAEGRMPKLKGIDYFNGETLHSHDYRVPDRFAGKNVLVIGGGFSGIDIANDISSTATMVYFSHHVPKPYPGYSDNVLQKPDVTEILSNRLVQFTDESTVSVDFIVFCTGYLYSFPFLSSNCQINVDNNHITTLYKHVVNLNHPTMFFIGINFITINSFTMEHQVRFALYFLLNPTKRPTKVEMFKDHEDELQLRISNGIKKKNMHRIGVDGILDYFNSLSDFAKIDRLKPVYAKLYKVGFNRVVNDPLNFRRYRYEILNDEEFIEEYI